MSSVVEDLYQKLLDSGLKEEDLQALIESRLKEYRGFMSQQGILFIIAKEHGINPYTDEYYKELDELIDYDEFAISIGELKEGMSNIILIGKITKIFKPREFFRKDNSVGLVGSFFLVDATAVVKVVLWDETVKLMQTEYFREGTLIRLIGGYSKLGRDEEIEVHIGKKGRLIIAPEDVNPKILYSLENLDVDLPIATKKSEPSIPIATLLEKYSFIQKIQGEVQIEQFKELTTKKGEQTFLLTLMLNDDTGSVKLNIWGLNAVEILGTLEDGNYVKITNLSAKMNSFSHKKELYYTKKSTISIL